MILYEQGLIFENKNNIISINLNHSDKFCLYYLESKDLVRIKPLSATYYLHFLMLLFSSMLALKNLNAAIQMLT